MADEDIPHPPPAARPHRLLSWLARRPFVVLALFCVALWAPGILSLPALDRDESRFAESSRQMLDSSNFIDIRFGQVPRYKKPVGIYWAQAAATALGGRVYGLAGNDTHIWTYRLPSLLGGVAALFLTYWMAAPLFGAEAGLLGALLLGSTLLLSAEASMATTDAVQLAAIVGMQGVLLRLYQARGQSEFGQTKISRRMVLWGWAALGIGILVKGPVAPGVAAATILALTAWRWRAERWQSLAWLKASEPLRGIALLALIVAPWLIAIGVQSHGAFFQQSLGNDFAAKVAGGQEGHGMAPGYYTLLAPITFWPAILFILPGIALGISRRGENGIRFLLAWAGSWWLVVEAVPTKLPNYALPAYPALSLLAALWLLSVKPAAAEAAPSILAPGADEQGVPVAAAPPRDWGKFLVWLAAAQFALGLAALVAAPILAMRRFGAGADPLVDGAAGFAALLGLIALGLFLAGRKRGAMAWGLAAVFVVVPLLTSVVAPRLESVWVSARLAVLVAKDRDLNDPPPVLAGYEEPSLVFALGADTAVSDGVGAAEIGARRGGLALVDDEEQGKFLARLAELQADATALDALSGFNYSRGRAVHVTVYRITALDPTSRPQPH